MYSVILEAIEGTRQLTIIAAAVVCVFDFQPVEYPSPAETENLEGRAFEHGNGASTKLSGDLILA